MIVNFLIENSFLTATLIMLFIALFVVSSTTQIKKRADSRIGAFFFEAFYSALGLAGYLLFAALGIWGIYYLWSFTRELLEFLRQLEPQASAQIVAASLTVMGSVAAVMIGQYLSKGRELKKTDRQRKMEILQSLISEVSLIIKNSDLKIDQAKVCSGIAEIYQKYLPQLFLWCSKSTLNKFYRMLDGENVHLIPAFRDFLNACRAEIGLGGELGMNLVQFLWMPDVEQRVELDARKKRPETS